MVAVAINIYLSVCKKKDVDLLQRSGEPNLNSQCGIVKKGVFSVSWIPSQFGRAQSPNGIRLRECSIYLLPEDNTVSE